MRQAAFRRRSTVVAPHNYGFQVQNSLETMATQTLPSECAQGQAARVATVPAAGQDGQAGSPLAQQVAARRRAGRAVQRQRPPQVSGLQRGKAEGMAGTAEGGALAVDRKVEHPGQTSMISWGERGQPPETPIPPRCVQKVLCGMRAFPARRGLWCLQSGPAQQFPVGEEW